MELQFINGEFSQSEAISLITQLVEVKIKYQEQKIKNSQNEEDVKMRELKIISLQKELADTRGYILKNTNNKPKMNNKELDFKLIDGEFSAEETQKILMSLINNKIDFHNLFAFSNHIRFNNDVNGSKKRIEELTQTREMIAEVTKKAVQEGYHFKVQSFINLEIVNDRVLNE